MSIQVNYLGDVVDDALVNFTFGLPESPSRSVILCSQARGGELSASVVGDSSTSVAENTSRELTFYASIKLIAKPIESVFSVQGVDPGTGSNWGYCHVYEVEGVGDLIDTALGDISTSGIDLKSGGLVIGSATNAEGEGNFAGDGNWTYLQNKIRHLTTAGDDAAISGHLISTSSNSVQVGHSSNRSQLATWCAASFAPSTQSTRRRRTQQQIIHGAF